MSNREIKIIAAIACPACGAPIGRACGMRGGRPMVCSARKAAWQEVRPTRAPDIIVTAAPRPAPVDHLRLAPQSAAARAAIDRARNAHGTWEPTGTLLVHGDAARDVIRRLIADGWITAETL